MLCSRDLLGEGRGDPVRRRLRHRIADTRRALARHACGVVLRRPRGQVDDDAASLLDHHRQAKVMEEKDGTEVRVDHRFEVAPVGIDELAHVAAVGVARVVYHHVEAPKLADRVIEDLPDVVHVTQVEAHGNGPPARGLDLLSGLPDRARPVIHGALRHGPRRHDDREPQPPKLNRDSLAHAPARPGHQRPPSIRSPSHPSAIALLQTAPMLAGSRSRYTTTSRFRRCGSRRSAASRRAY